VRQPAYQLRPNKTIDRLTLIEVIRRITNRYDDIGEYIYCGFGGPTLEDFRILHAYYPEVTMISVEENEEIYKRQLFHAPCRGNRLKLKHTDFSSFLATYACGDKKSIFWLDYTGLEYSNFEEFMIVLGMVPSGSIIKITLRCHPDDFQDSAVAEQEKKQAEFCSKFESILPAGCVGPPLLFEDFAKLLQDMVQISAQKMLPSGFPLRFLPICSFCYADGVGMFTLTGVVCLGNEVTALRAAFNSWHLRNLDWSNPRVIDVPMLSTKERLHLQRLLPQEKNAGRILRNALGYLIDMDIAKTESRLQHYSDFQAYFPYFMKANP